MAWLLFWWSPRRRRWLIGPGIEPLGETYLRDVLEFEQITREEQDSPTDADIADDWEDTDE